MNTAYNTFLTALMVEYYHDRIADNITTSLNVTWSRTNPVIVSVAEDPYQIYETLESDHSMGMTVIGTIEDMRVFNFEISSYIPFIEYEIICSAYNSTFSSVAMKLIYLSSNYNTYVEAFEYNGFIIIKSTFNDFMVIDLETGIVRDIDTVNNCYGGIYAFGGRTTEYGKLFSVKESTTPLCCITWLGYRYYHWQVSNPWDLGNVGFWWNGKGNVSISSNGNSLADISADNILTITGTNNGEITVEGTQAALDITDILNRFAGLQTLHLVLEDTDGYFIGTSPLYVVQTTLKKEEVDLLPLFPTPVPTWPPSSRNGTNPSYDPFPYPPSEIPVDMNHIVDIFWRDVLHSTPSSYNPGVFPGPEIHINPSENIDAEIIIPCWYNPETDMWYIYKIYYYQ